MGHGQMDEKELETVMLKFVKDEADVLVSTTIVENGLDIPAGQHDSHQSRGPVRTCPNCINCAAAWGAGPINAPTRT